MKLPVLYKKTSTGAIQYWKIWTEKSNQGFKMYPCIVTEYGQLGTDSPQITYDHIKEGKNVGRKNETSATEQADAEAQAKWEKQKKKGYVENVDDAHDERVDEIIEGGVVPMLAQKFSDHSKKIKYPVFIQPKLDGIRCIAVLKKGKCTLWSRTRKRIKSCPHIVAEIEKRFVDDIILDGELYNHQYKTNFEQIVSLVRQDKKPDPRCTEVQYHVYDLVNDQTFENRFKTLRNAFTIGNPEFQYLRLVTTVTGSEDDVSVYFANFKDRGYEGAMLRNADSFYVNKRSYDLQKVKEFDDGEFDIVGIEEGRGKLAGHVGAFICRTDDERQFSAKMSGDTDKLRDYFEDHSLWEGKKLTVQYQGLTGAEGVPRFPVGVAIRDYE